MLSHDVIMTSNSKKIQFGGWEKRRWKEIRQKIKRAWKKNFNNV